MKALKVSFIIPAYNEESRIQKTIEAIIDHVPGEFEHEIIVVDHGSEDDTCGVVQAMPVTLLSHPEGSVAGLRNFGVKDAFGSVLVFIDADVLLTSKWTERFRKVAPLLASDGQILTGSWVSVPDNASWIERNWFKPLQKGSNTHINSGHMIIAMKDFERIGGFDEQLQTGEDYEISMRARSFGIDIIDDVQLEAVHEGYPKSVKDFFLREYWHGKGDAHSLSLLFKSKVALISLVFFILHLCMLCSTFVALTCIVALVFLVTIVKYKRQKGVTILINMFLYYIYFWARAFSLVALFGMNKVAKRER